MELVFRRYMLPVVIGLFIIGIAVMSAVAHHQYWLLSLVFIGLAMLPFFMKYEAKKMQSREVMMMVMLIAIAAVSRVPFAAIPSVLPMTFIIIVSALVFGAESGFMIGALSAIVSNIFLGQGPWTPWQMFSWGMIGCFAGLLKDTWWMRSMWGKVIFSFVVGILFGWVMNLTSVIATMADISWGAILTLYAASAIFDLLHASSNVVFMLVFGNAWIRILRRFKKKYGLS
jgi:energy-coupling factor transport system substrate-specific component